MLKFDFNVYASRPEDDKGPADLEERAEDADKTEEGQAEAAEAAQEEAAEEVQEVRSGRARTRRAKKAKKLIKNPREQTSIDVNELDEEIDYDNLSAEDRRRLKRNSMFAPTSDESSRRKAARRSGKIQYRETLESQGLAEMMDLKLAVATLLLKATIMMSIPKPAFT